MTVNTPTTSNLRRWLFAGAMTAISLGTLTALSMLTIFYRPYSVPSSSMTPTLLLGDYFWVARTVYGWRLPAAFSGLALTTGNDPERGDIAVFALPRDPQIVYIKRVIGLPGDTVELKAGILILNGTSVEREPAGKFSARGPGGDLETSACFTEKLPGGVSYDIIETYADGELDDSGPFSVPPGHYFVLGDNRDNSVDSRMSGDVGVGFVPRENFLGRADLIMFSPHSATGHRPAMLKPVAASGCKPITPS